MTTGLMAAIVLSPATAQDQLGELIPTMSIVYYAPDAGPEDQQAARILVEDFGKLGLDIELRPLQQSSMVSQIHVGGGLEDLAFGSWGGDPDRLDPNFWVFDLTACGSRRNAVKWCDETYTAKAKEQAATLDEEKRLELVWELQEYAQEQLPWWQVGHEANGLLYNSDRWENITSPTPIPPHETVLHPWLTMTPKGDDRIVDWAHFEDVSTYNPLTEQTSQGWLKFVYDPYVRFDGGDIVPWAVASWTPVDDTTLELTLREGMTFHDGEPVTAADAVFSLNKMVELQPPVLADSLVAIEGAEEVDELTFRINLAEPNPAILRQGLTDLVILPKHIWENVEDPMSWDPIPDNGVIGSGPFTFESWERNQRHVLNTFKDHWAAPAYDGLRRLSLGQADAVRAAMVDGSADIATTVLPVATMEQLGQSEDHLDFELAPTFSTKTVWVNHEKAPFNDLQFRKALKFATDKERIVLEGFLGFGSPAGEGIVPTALGKWYNSDLEVVPFDIEQARKVLQDAGYGWDSDGRLHFPPG
jgi:peptide/nickel transport system substrate-binding protein